MIGALVVVGIYTIVAGDQGILPRRALALKEARLNEEILAAERRLHALERDWDDLQRTRELRARTEYNMVRPNEIIYEIAPADSATWPRLGSSPGEP